jgi:hypothetical protein
MSRWLKPVTTFFGRATVGDEHEPTPRAWRQRFLSIPGVAATTAVTAAVSWGVVELIKEAQTSIAHGAPVAVSVETNPASVSAFAGQPIGLVLPAGTRTLGNPGPACDDFRPWARSHGGIDAGETMLAVVVQGKSDAAVLLSQLQPKIVSGPSQPKHGIQVSCPSQGDAEMRAITVDLDRGRTRYRSKSGAPFGFTVANGETETLDIVARTRRATYKWVLKLELVVAGKKEELTIDDHGQPFQTTGGPSRAWWSWNWDYHGAWFNGAAGPAKPGIPAGGHLPQSRAVAEAGR